MVIRQHPLWWWSVVAIVMTSLLTTGLSIAVSLRAIRISEQKLCGVVVISDDFQRSAPIPPNTPPERAAALRKYAVEIHKLRQSLHCDSKGGNPWVTPTTTPSSPR